MIVKEMSKNEGIIREKQLKKEVVGMRRDLEEAFGLTKITQLENKHKELNYQREQLENEIKVLHQVEENQQKALDENIIKSKKGLKHIGKLE